MRLAYKLVVVMLMIAAAAAWWRYWRTHRPSRLSGIVVDIRTRTAVPGVRVRPKFMNGRGEGVVTDKNGHFTLSANEATEAGGVFVDDPRYAGLFGKVVGRERHGFRPGDRDDDMVVPAIPAAELGGKALDESGNPVSGCRIELLEPKRPSGPLVLMASNRDARTGPDGKYQFTHLDAGIYYLLAKCNAPSRGDYRLTRYESKPRQDEILWQNLLYPHADKLSEAKAVIAMPGQQIGGLDFRMRKTAAFLVTGRFIWVKGEAPQPLDVYANDFSLTSLDLGLARDQTESTCQWNVYPGRFECVQVTPGRYRLSMSISPLWINAIRGLPKEENLQLGKMETDLKRSPPGPLALKMQKKVWEDTRPKKSAEAGWLDVQLAGCGSHDFPVARLSIWDENGVASQEVHYIAQGKHAGEDELPPGRYRVFATCRTYWGSFHDSYLPELIAEKALPIIVRAGQTAKIHLNALTAEDIYRLAVAHLQQQSALNK